MVGIAAALVLAAPASSQAATLSLAPTSHGKGMLAFDLDSLDGASIRAATLRGPGVRRSLSTRRVQRASRRGVVRVRGWSPRPSAARARRVAGQRRAWRTWRLFVVVGDRRRAEPESPPQATSADACTPAFGSFGVNSWPAGCWRPYASDSPFNTPLPSSPRIHPNSDAIVERLMRFGPADSLVAGAADTSWDYYHPVYYSRPHDPVFTVACTMYGGQCPIAGHRVRIPDAARPAGGTDRHLTVVDQPSGWEYDFWNVQRKPGGGGTLHIGWGGRTHIHGDGLRSGGTAAEFGGLAGIIRAQELAAGRIDHALFMVVKCVTNEPRFVYPATKEATFCPDPANAPATGQHFQLAMSPAEIQSLRVPAWKKTILRAMAEYGMFVGDTGGNAWGLQFESGSTYTSFGYADPLVAFARENGIPDWGTGRYWFNLRDGVDWRRRLRVVDPCVAAGSGTGGSPPLEASRPLLAGGAGSQTPPRC